MYADVLKASLLNSLEVPLNSWNQSEEALNILA